MEEEVLLLHLNKIENLIEQDNLQYAKRYNNRELDNLKGITEQKCKLHKLNRDHCKTCKNLTCNLNNNENMKKKEWNMSSKEIIEDDMKKEMYAKNFSKFFNTELLKSDFSKLPMLSFILEKFSTDFDEDMKDVLELRNEQYKVFEKLSKDFTDEEKSLMEKYQEIESDIEYKEKEKTFVMGYLIGLKLSQEFKID